MPLDLINPNSGEHTPAFPGARGFLILAKLRGMRNVTRESHKRLKALLPDYCEARGLPMPPAPKKKKEENGQEESTEAEEKDEIKEEEEMKEEVKEEEKEEIKVEEEMKEEGTTQNTELESSTVEAETSLVEDEKVIKFGPNEIMYENCSFVTCTVEDPGDYAHFVFSRIADDPDWPQPRFPLRIMPVHEITCPSYKTMERAITPWLTEVFSGDEPIRFSIVHHGKHSQNLHDMTRNQMEALVRNIIWSINPNCVQCIKYQDYAILLETVEPLLFFGIAKEFFQLGRYNTASAKNGRDPKETMTDSEDDISDDPELSEADNTKMKLMIKKKRRKAKYEEENLKKAKLEAQNLTNGEEGKGDATQDDVEIKQEIGE